MKKEKKPTKSATRAKKPARTVAKAKRAVKRLPKQKKPEILEPEVASVPETVPQPEAIEVPVPEELPPAQITGDVTESPKDFQEEPSADEEALSYERTEEQKPIEPATPPVDGQA